MAQNRDTIRLISDYITCPKYLVRQQTLQLQTGGVCSLQHHLSLIAWRRPTRWWRWTGHTRIKYLEFKPNANREPDNLIEGKGVGNLTVKLQPVTCSSFKQLRLYPLLPLTYLLQDGSSVKKWWKWLLFCSADTFWWTMASECPAYWAQCISCGRNFRIGVNMRFTSSVLLMWSRSSRENFLTGSRWIQHSDSEHLFLWKKLMQSIPLGKYRHRDQMRSEFEFCRLDCHHSQPRVSG